MKSTKEKLGLVFLFITAAKCTATGTTLETDSQTIPKTAQEIALELA